MQIDHALILCAGMGTRMGEIGKKLPKALWPIYFKSMLELQVDYCRSLGINRIFINTHFLGEEIERLMASSSKFKDVVLLAEDPLLDSGGAVHNMASRGDVNYMGNLLYVNADQFLLFNQSYFEKALKLLSTSRAVLFGIKVAHDSHYNETVIANGLLTDIRKPEGEKDFITYSGLGLIKLDDLNPVPGITKFFQTVCNYNKEAIRFVTPDEYEYWDFGTADIYFENIKKISAMLKDKYAQDSLIIKFLKQHGALIGDLDSFIDAKLNSIDLAGKGLFEKDSISGKGIVQKVEI
jgi:choline kinase